MKIKVWVNLKKIIIGIWVLGEKNEVKNINDFFLILALIYKTWKPPVATSRHFTTLKELSK